MATSNTIVNSLTTASADTLVLIIGYLYVPTLTNKFTFFDRSIEQKFIGKKPIPIPLGSLGGANLKIPGIPLSLPLGLGLTLVQKNISNEAPTQNAFEDYDVKKRATKVFPIISSKETITLTFSYYLKNKTQDTILRRQLLNVLTQNLLANTKQFPPNSLSAKEREDVNFNKKWQSNALQYQSSTSLIDLSGQERWRFNYYVSDYSINEDNSGNGTFQITLTDSFTEFDKFNHRDKDTLTTSING